MLPTTYVKIGITVLVLAGVAFTAHTIRSLKADLREADVILGRQEARITELEGLLTAATTSKAEVDAKLIVADAARAQMIKDFNKRIDRINVAPIPQTCPGAMDWMMENIK